MARCERGEWGEPGELQRRVFLRNAQRVSFIATVAKSIAGDGALKRTRLFVCFNIFIY